MKKNDKKYKVKFVYIKNKSYASGSVEIESDKDYAMDNKLDIHGIIGKNSYPNIYSGDIISITSIDKIN